MRDYIAERKEYLNLSALCRKADISKQCLNMFLKGYDGSVSKEKLEHVVELIKNIS